MYSYNSFLQVVYPERIQGNASNNVKEQISYVIAIDEKLYTVHLRPRYFLTSDFKVYLYNQSVANSHSADEQSECYYQGYIKEYPYSIVTLSTCSGLRGILQFENVSYGIEPLDSSSEFQHILYQLGNENSEHAIFTQNSRSMEKYPVDYNIFISEKAKTPVTDLPPVYVEMYVVVDKALYDYLGSDSTTITKKFMEMINLINSMFSQFKVVVLLSSLELWSDTNKISTIGKADEVLYRFSKWEQSHLTLKPHDVTYLFIHRDNPDYVGATFPGKMCATPYSAGIALYPKGITLEKFSIIVTQILGLSLGIAYDDPTKCQCPEAICVMNLEAMKSSGKKTFSSCSLSDFESFISNVGAACLQNKPVMQQQAVCGNGIREGNEVCDCGTLEQCGIDNCCNHENCRKKLGTECLGGPCCNFCKYRGSNVICRDKRDPHCDVPEYCTGSSEHCPQDLTVINGQRCKNRLMCYSGICVDLDARCVQHFGKGSVNAPFVCYKEVHVHVDKFGHCGMTQNKFKYCGWRNFHCGRLVCTYNSKIPFFATNATAIYFRIQNYSCITALFPGPKDLLQIPNGTSCDTGRMCLGYSCVEKGNMSTVAESCTRRCSGRGVCNTRHQCHCNPGFRPPNCALPQSFKPSRDMNRGLIRGSASKKVNNNWLMSFYIGLSIFIIATITAVAWNRPKNLFSKEKESLSSESIADDTAHTLSSRSKSEESIKLNENTK
ncbi:disintegrin and metalloproteinase domain-containing protein 32-like [Octodon degus]|uniref:Disintegrin and metalloproteinase domain-containing protein 32-like n=1 Tax=Octodon degus TaxID=10160 RepID=A0A6P6EZT9_OCTDE|nr:disintegrin and metalloproteinase domain-containing protein 32-like [Octodon degus]